MAPMYNGIAFARVRSSMASVSSILPVAQKVSSSPYATYSAPVSTVCSSQDNILSTHCEPIGGTRNRDWRASGTAGTSTKSSNVFRSDANRLAWDRRCDQLVPAVGPLAIQPLDLVLRDYELEHNASGGDGLLRVMCCSVVHSQLGFGS